MNSSFDYNLKFNFWTIIILESPENFSLPLLYRFYVKLPNDCYKFQENNQNKLTFFSKTHFRINASKLLIKKMFKKLRMPLYEFWVVQLRLWRASKLMSYFKILNLLITSHFFVGCHGLKNWKINLLSYNMPLLNVMVLL